jgi:hypothetical protein
LAKISEVELEERARRLEGKTLRAVKYQGAWTSLEDPPQVHSITHAVHLELDGGARIENRGAKRSDSTVMIEITAADELGIVHGVGISIRERKVLDPAYGAIASAGGEPGWKQHVGSSIVRAMVHWDDIFERLRGSLSIGISIHADYLRRRDFPMTLELSFPSASVFVSAAQLAKGVALPLAPELVVFFSEKTGEALGLRRS